MQREIGSEAESVELGEHELVERVCGAPVDGGALREVGLARLSRWTPARMQSERLVDPAGATRLCAAFELGRRVERGRRRERAALLSPRSVWEHVIPELRGQERETFLALLLDGKRRLQRRARVSEGTLDFALVHPREVFGPALREGAGSLIVVHNHPSGDPEPSPEDLEITRRLLDIGQLLGVPLVDHVVVSDTGWVSLRERMGFGGA